METFSVFRGIWSFRREHYSHIEDGENNQLFEKSKSVQRDSNSRACGLRTKLWILLTGLNTLLLCITALVVVVAIPRTSRMPDVEAIKQTHSYSTSQTTISEFLDLWRLALVFEPTLPSLKSILLNGSLFNYPPRLNRSDPSSAMKPNRASL